MQPRVVGAIGLGRQQLGLRLAVLAGVEQRVAARDPGLLDIQTRPEFDAFKGDPRYQRALRQMNLAR